MMPLGYIRSYDDFSTRFRELVEERNRSGRGFAFLFDDSQLSLWRSRLTRDHRSMRLLNDALGEDFTVFYLHDELVGRPQHGTTIDQYRKRIDEFNRTLVANLGIAPETIKFPCIVFFRVAGDACTHVRSFALERTPLLLVPDILAAVDSYRACLASTPAPASHQTNLFLPLRAPLAVVDVVNAVCDFAAHASETVQALLP